MRIIIVILGVLLSYSPLSAQGFTAKAVAGITASQIDGDDLYGFTKIGATGGFAVGYDFRSRWTGHIELLYSQRGSNATFGYSSETYGFIHTDYLEVPLVLSVRDWYVEDDNYYKAGLHIGPSLGYLFNVHSNISEAENDIDNYNNIDLSFVLGGTFRLTKHWGCTIRYTRAMTSLRGELFNNVKSRQYYWTFRTEYNF